ncbi:acetoacetate decarboxylase [Nocardia tenerifensis]|uniref:Acetoacetate decarboxylase n=1 Tax=Nocardia tenerifensis TaxID=228006 RepID=A0A318JZ43_9NOCA|nr:acetoacetate decarboxylase [Nocardia tenerifensis]PXX59640.1 acetoacetate decarboxylase [Nocardia tenerifensis]
MRAEDVVKQPIAPLTAPAYPLRGARFYDREYFNVLYRTDPELLRAIVPEPLELVEPVVRFEVMHMGDVAGFGPYTESGQVVEVSYQGERGEYLVSMYLDNIGATVSGREAGAWPKSMGTPRLFTEQGALVGTLDYGSQRVATATMGYKWQPMDLDEARNTIAAPTYAVKTIPGHNGAVHSIDLVRTQITDIAVKQAWRGPARLGLFPHVMAPLADLPVLEVIEGQHIVTDLQLQLFEPVHNYYTGA